MAAARVWSYPIPYAIGARIASDYAGRPVLPPSQTVCGFAQGQGRVRQWPRRRPLPAVLEPVGSQRSDRQQFQLATDPVCAAHSDTACPHVHVAVTRVDPETGRAVNLDKGATRRLSRWAEQYERDHGGIVVPGRVERREARAARRRLERRCRKSGMPREQARSTAARLHPRSAAKQARKRPPSPAGSPPGQRAQWTQRVERQRGEVRRQRTVEDEQVERRRREWRTYQAARAVARAAAGPVPSPPRSASIRTLRADGARQRVELRRRHRTGRASLARRFGRAAVRPLRRGAAAIRKLFRKHRPEVAPEAERRQFETERRQLEARLADARRRRARQIRDRLSEAATRTGIAHEHANDDLQYHERLRREARDERTQRRADAAHEAWYATRHARHRSELRLLVYENAARAVDLDLSRRCWHRTRRHSSSWWPRRTGKWRRAPGARSSSAALRGGAHDTRKAGGTARSTASRYRRTIDRLRRRHLREPGVFPARGGHPRDRP